MFFVYRPLQNQFDAVFFYVVSVVVFFVDSISETVIAGFVIVIQIWSWNFTFRNTDLKNYQNHWLKFFSSVIKELICYLFSWTPCQDNKSRHRNKNFWFWEIMQMQNNIWFINITKILNFDFYNYKQNMNLFFIFKSQLRKTLWLNSDLPIKLYHILDRLSFYPSYKTSNKS